MNVSASGSKRTPAFQVFVVKTEVLPQSNLGYLFRWSLAWVAFLRTLFKSFGPLLEPVGPRVRILVLERATGKIVYERILRRDDGRFAPTIRRLVEDVRELDFPSFLSKYHIGPR